MLIDTIKSPSDLKAITRDDLPQVCQELRTLILDVVSKNGGHIAPSLGVVEISTALHYVFDSPKDKIVWDVGHQSYAHKILTGRRDAFETLRKPDGLSGFPKIHESEHDAFGTGHSSTSISAALGIAKAYKRKGIQNRAIAVIGDGSMTGGLAFEALNQAGHKAGNLVIILNDNEMSISPNVGALSKFFSVNLHGKVASGVKRRIKRLV
ncbi:1-deoxy-D-xylulose-5-phosphate synthase, partial [bacterium]|nr:1-deoxy-D-xylulose-5-phosphate synthase [bacterium]